MKKLLSLLLCCLLSFSLVGCELMDALKTLEPSGEETSTTAPVSGEEFEYKKDDTNEKVEELRLANGYLFRYEITTSDEGGEDNKTIAFGSKGDIYYMNDGSSEYYFDLSSEESGTQFSKSGDDEWTKTTVTYSEDISKDQLKQMMDLLFANLSAWVTVYDSYSSSLSGAAKSNTTVAGRACDEYAFSDATILPEVGSVRAVFTCSIDKETGICLKWDYRADINGVEYFWTIECTEFNTNPRFTLPTVVED